MIFWKNARRVFLTIAILLFFCWPGFETFVFADELEEITKQIADLQDKFSKMEVAKAGVEKSLAPLEKEIKTIQKRIDTLAASITVEEGRITALDKSITKREASLSAKYEIFSERVRRFYIRQTYGSPLLWFFSSGNAIDLTREFGYRRSLEDEDKRVIAEIAQQLVDLDNDKREVQIRKEKLASEKIRLASVQKDLDTKAAPLRKVIAEAEAYQNNLTVQISALTARQQALLTEKTGTFATSVGDVPLADDPNSRPDFNPGFSPAFAAFSFGAPHRRGMSQYGAFGRAKSGQSAEDILKAYYGSGIEIKRDYSTSININVEGYGSVDIETYAKRIYEMPGSWGDEGGHEALKAQAVAARSYALARTNNGAGSICATEYCQVYKPQNKGGNWDRAVDDTKGWVLIANGKPFSAWYASTSGGYNFSYSSEGYSTPGGWDTKCGSQGCWTGDAYEKIAGSPWFYKSWYKTRDGTSCGRSHPWLSQEEFTDILNAIIVSKADAEASKHIFPVDVNSCFGKNEDVWNMGKMREEANKYGGAVTSVSSISTSYSMGGTTASIKIQTNRGELSFSGDEFKTIFNLRAPGRIFLQSTLFNVEKK
jgi:peptidoglycan hydrolase-like amidase